MSRRASSSSSSPSSSSRPLKRQRTEHLTSESFKNGVMLAPMVRSGALPTRLYALKHGAKLVWSPEVVDKAILHAERVVDSQTGVISYNGVSKAIFTTHPIEKPYLVYQIGSADPKLAVQAAKTVLQDVSGIDLNCGCPKPFSTHAGMGAALLTNPDLLCSILTALRTALPPEITVSAKIRLLSEQNDTLKLVERIVNTGISALTIHCRTRNMRPRERALIGRLREIVEFVGNMGKGVAVIENGDCVSREDAMRLRGITGADSFMIATAAESNPTCFSPAPLPDLMKTFTPAYIQLGKYLGNHFANTKYCAAAFKGANHDMKKAERQQLQNKISRAKSYDELNDFVGGLWDGAEEMQKIVKSIESRVDGVLYAFDPPPSQETQMRLENDMLDTSASSMAEAEYLVTPTGAEAEKEVILSTPPERENPEPPTLNAPLLPSNEQLLALPSLISELDETARVSFLEGSYEQVSVKEDECLELAAANACALILTANYIDTHHTQRLPILTLLVFTMSTHIAIAATAKGVLEQVQLPTPTPGPGEVLIKVQYAAFIPLDSSQLDIAYKLADDPYPHVLGYSAAGEIKSIGEGVSDLKEGDRVTSYTYPLSKNKASQEYVLIGRNLVAKVPGTFPLHAAASIPDNYVTAMFTLFGLRNLALPIPPSFPALSPPPNADTPILVYGASSSSGQYLVQLLKLAGYTKILVTASPHNHSLLRDLGATQCFDYRSPELATDILMSTGGDKVPTVVDCISSRTSIQAISSVIEKGTRIALLMPVKDGDTLVNSPDSEMHFGIPPWTASLLKDAEILQVYTFKHQEEVFAKENYMQKILPKLLEDGLIRPNPVRLMNEGTLKERVEKGLDLLRKNKISGEKVVVDFRG
ncbi:hypothetical protein EW145_g1353 [Phellinidium pouzarii]|uniref:Enoyl reductase (ER) domain-containing protein n=1 Tax=Phellinidium pouzarii TaxID=167371 RepID=A0A4S4LET3_9AGAM|nr:hypothetical protein EW145_g1353 [Phellinidium pouzarii]